MSEELRGNFPNTIIRASAGTGKTFALSNRYLQLLASGAEPETILATTFTRKGAGEILDRIIQRLSDAALDDAAAKKLSEEISYELPQERAANILHELLKNLHQLEISTLDSFFNRVAKAFSLEIGLPPNWDIVEQQQIEVLSDDAIQQVLRDDSVHSLLHMMSKGEAQRRVATLIRDTVAKVYATYLEAQDYETWDKLPESGQRLSESDLNLVVAQANDVELTGKALPKHWATVLPLINNGNWEGVVKTKSFQNVLAGNPKYGNSKLTPEILAVYNKLIPHCTAVVTDRLISQNHSTYKLLNRFARILERTKDETGQLRFDDVANRLLEFIQGWDTEQFSFRLDHQIQHLLLDEFQDTSPIQWKIVRPFAQQVTEPDSLRSFFCVGDMKQAIFGWRGGVAEIFDLVNDELPGLNADEFTSSWRSSPEVVELVNQVFGNLSNFSTKDEVVDAAIHGWPAWFSEHQTHRNELSGYVSFEYGEDCTKEDRAAKDSQSRVPNVRNENMYAAVVARVQQLSKDLPDHKNIGVLVRTNAEVGELIFGLRQAGIPASEEGGNAITDSAVVEIILSAICLADHPSDDLARYHVSHSPLAELFGLEPEDDQNQDANRTAANRGAAELRMGLIRDGYGPTVESLARILTPMCTRRELIRLQHLVRVAYAAPSDVDRWETRPKRFVDFVRDEVRIADQSGAQVRVMTIHKSKGLEFDSVVLPMKFVTNGWFVNPAQVIVGRDSPTDPISIACRYVGEEFRNLLPTDFKDMFSADRARTVREAMCVLYVALTRAVHSTHIVASYGCKPHDKSSAGVVLASLGLNAKDRKPGIVYEFGDANWFSSIEGVEPASTDPHAIQVFYLPEEPALKRDSVSREIRSARGLRAASPSGKEGGEAIHLSSIFKTHDNQDALIRGSMIHGCFALVTWLDQGGPTRADMVAHLKTLDSTLDDYERYVIEFESMLDHKSVADLLTHSSYLQDFVPEFALAGDVMLEAHRLEVETERAFAVNLDGEILSGFIDRVVWVYEGDKLVGADVIDFKSDPVNAKSLGERIDHYRPQLNAYRKAVSKMTGLPTDKISARLLFVETGQSVIIDPGAPTTVAPVKKPKLKSNAKSKTKAKPKSIGTKIPKPKRAVTKHQKTLWDD